MKDEGNPPAMGMGDEGPPAEAAAEEEGALMAADDGNLVAGDGGWLPVSKSWLVIGGFVTGWRVFLEFGIRGDWAMLYVVNGQMDIRTYDMR